MRIIKVDKPFQGDTTLDKQCINGEYPNWVVKTESAKIHESFNEWWTRKIDYMENNPAYKDVSGIYLYDVQPVTEILGPDRVVDPKLWALHIRYDYINQNKDE